MEKNKTKYSEYFLETERTGNLNLEREWTEMKHDRYLGQTE